MPKETLDPPRLKHFTLDPLKPIGADVDDERNELTMDDVPPAVAFNAEEAEQVRALSDQTREQFEERQERERSEREERAKSDERAPKPSELLASRQGAGTESKKSESKQSSSKSESKS